MIFFSKFNVFEKKIYSTNITIHAEIVEKANSMNLILNGKDGTWLVIEKGLQFKLNYSIFSIAVVVGVVVGKCDIFQKILNGQLLSFLEFDETKRSSNEK